MPRILIGEKFVQRKICLAKILLAKIPSVKSLSASEVSVALTGVGGYVGLRLEQPVHR